MKLQKKDFIEIEFTGRIKNGEIFDSNIKEDLQKLDSNLEPKPFVFCLGEGMFLKGVEDFLINKEINKYKIELNPENAFGIRDPKLIQTMPTSVFKNQKVSPTPGALFNFDGRMAKILTVSGGRIMVDFNHVLAGKKIIYQVSVLKKVEDLNEQVKSFINFLFKKDLKFEIKENKIILEIDKSLSQFVKLFSEKFKEIFNMDLEVKEIEEINKELKKEIKEKKAEK